MQKKDDGNPLNPEHIYIAGFWSNGSTPFVIDSVFLSNSTEYDLPTFIVNNSRKNEIVSTSYYTLNGQKVQNIGFLHGVFIKKTTLADGEIEITKIIKP